jgi:hypothetical protein
MDAGQHSSFFNQVFCVPTLGRSRERWRSLEASAQAAIAPDERLIDQRALARWADDGGRWVNEKWDDRSGVLVWTDHEKNKQALRPSVGAMVAITSRMRSRGSKKSRRGHRRIVSLSAP